MIVKVDEAAFGEAGLTFQALGGVAEFGLAGRPERVRVRLVGDQLHFVPGRSAGQRDVLAALGRAS